MYSDEELKSLAELRRKRGVVKAALTRAQTFVSNFVIGEQAVSLLEFRQEELPQINRKFDDIQSQIELIAIDDTVEAETERNNFEELYFMIRSQMQEIIKADKASNTSAHNASQISSSSGHRNQLAPIPLPSFDGNIQEWSSFFDIFRAIVHEGNDYSDAQKFYYLRSCLQGQALDLVRSIPINDGNYSVVVERHKQRYDNPSLVIQSHIRSLLECPRIEEPSASALQELYSHVSTHVAALSALDQPIEHWDAWLITIVTGRLDRSTRHGWQLHLRNTDLPKYSDLESFLASRCVALEGSEAVGLNQKGSKVIPNNSGTRYPKQNQLKEAQLTQSANSKKFGAHSRGALLAASEVKEKCAYCTSMHRLYTCSSFKNLSVGDRINFVRETKLCFNCLHPAHAADKCRSRYNCFVCKGKHNTLLHYERKGEPSKFVSDEDMLEEGVASSSNQTGSKKVLLVHQGHGHVFLSTAVVLVRDHQGVRRKCHAILDSGSQVNFISKGLAKQLQLPAARSLLPVSGIGANTLQSSAYVDVNVESRFGSSSFNLSCHTLPVIMSQLQPVRTPVEGWTIPSELLPQLADPYFCDSKQIDLLIGGGAFFDILQPSRIQLDVKMLYLQDSKLGWIVTGELSHTCLLSVGRSLEEESKVILGHEDVLYDKQSKANQCSIEENQALEHFQSTFRQNEEGRFVLQLPVKTDLTNLGQSVNSATSRFLSVERKLQQDADLRIEYTKFMKDYLEMGHMQEIVKESNIPKRSCYLPHHAVFKSSSLTTKIRIVFDASARTSSGLSLNDVLMRGPKTQEDIFSILTRFRKYQYVISSDIEKMFRQVAVAEQDWDLQRIFWRNDPSEALRTYRLVTVTYGTKPASFMTTQCLVTLAQQAYEHFPRAADAITKDFYMDDLMTGGETEAECIQLYQEITSILASAKLPLRKWCSNSSYVLGHIGKNVRDPLFTLELGDEEMVKSHGLCWNPVLDEFRFNVIPTPARSKLTKRTLLSDLDKVFDPIGFISPILVKGKIFLQQVWALKIDWDSPLSSDIHDRWMSFHKDLEKLQNLSVPRKVLPKPNEFQIHGFCDASQEAYGACIYVRSRCSENTWQVRLLCARSRVAPIKGSTIPRLELNGALVLAQLLQKLTDAWEIDRHKCHLWTDSTVVLSWLNAQSNRLKVYVSNRVNQILELTNASQWNYVRTDKNPADMISRGTNVTEISASKLWWNGPDWLGISDELWEKIPRNRLKEEEIPEQRTIQFALVGVQSNQELVQHYSSWSRLQRATTWLKRFVEYLRTRRVPSEVHLSVRELQAAEVCILKQVQAEHFLDELRSLESQRELNLKSKLKSLSPFIKDGLILVGGRLNNSGLSMLQRHPIVLPANHKVTRLIFERIHLEQLHCGPQALLAEVRRRYWPLKSRVMARSVVSRCVKCTRAKPTFNAPLMAPLPKERVQVARPFAVTGVDFAGPILIRSGIRRVIGVKAWIAVFVCFTTRAVHLEMVEDLSSQAFLASLRRFTARRGLCSTIFSDNGTNFVGARRELYTHVKAAHPQIAQRGIEWRFNPPSAPHFGGLWESAVKSAKHHLTRMMSDAKLTVGELSTLLCQIEACLNSRPLTPMSSDPSDLEVLTPAHFLIGSPISLPPEVDLRKEPLNSLRRWKYVQALMQLFWRRWSSEYLPQLQIRGKWTSNKTPLKIGDIAIVRDENTPPTKWKLGRVLNVHPGKDGIIRVVTIRLGSGAELKRPTVKLCPLPTEADSMLVETPGVQRGEDVQANE